MRVSCWSMLTLVLMILATALVEAVSVGEPAADARTKVAEFLVWERSVKPSGLYPRDLGGAVPGIVSPELLCLLNAASGTYRFVSTYQVAQGQQGPRIAAAAATSASPAACAPPSLRRLPPIPPQGQSSARGWGNSFLA